ncbi:hypothetical protein ACVNS2_04645 [Paenibacillus caseinilyticus]|uniref:hypothetical protein n=1 Tax=Paenibacillus mucilaginosus TaxID=61624 RepID=UPI000FFEAA75|nr:hypothetical protein [Paenibacillus mucilaginosus]WFA16696.1 hypothetical protein ERY13_04625 [Paenibacillus mucilaginosus]
MKRSDRRASAKAVEAADPLRGGCADIRLSGRRRGGERRAARAAGWRRNGQGRTAPDFGQPGGLTVKGKRQSSPRRKPLAPGACICSSVPPREARKPYWQRFL